MHMLVEKYPCIAPVRNFSHGEHGEGGHGLTVRDGAVRHRIPPTFNRKTRPLRRLESMDPQPILNETPKPNGEAAIDK
jgi:hypothetical protein